MINKVTVDSQEMKVVDIFFSCDQKRIKMSRVLHKKKISPSEDDNNRDKITKKRGYF